MKAAFRTGRRHDVAIRLGKTFARTGSFGPWLVTVDEIPDPSKLSLQTRPQQRGRSEVNDGPADYRIPALISYCSTSRLSSPAT